MKEFNCESCQCDENHEHPMKEWVIPGVIQTKQCLRRMVSDRSIMFLEMYHHYKNGVLPFSKGFYEHPHVYVKAMTIIDREMK